MMPFLGLGVTFMLVLRKELGRIPSYFYLSEEFVFHLELFKCLGEFTSEGIRACSF